jgi:hypothetical protein
MGMKLSLCNWGMNRKRKRDEVTGGWTKLHNDGLRNLYSLPNIIRMIKSRRMRWTGHMAWIGQSHHCSRSVEQTPWENIRCSFNEVEVNLRPTVRRPVCLGVRHPSGTRNQFFFLLEISFRQLLVCYFVTPSLTRGRVCNLLYNCFWALPELSLLGRSPVELKAIFYCLIWDSPNLEVQVPIFVSPRNRVVQIYPRALGSLFVTSYDSQRLLWRYSNPPPHGFNLMQKLPTF